MTTPLPRRLNSPQLAGASSAAAIRAFAPFASLEARPVLDIYQSHCELLSAGEMRRIDVEMPAPAIVAIPLPAVRPRLIGAVLAEGREFARTGISVGAEPTSDACKRWAGHECSQVAADDGQSKLTTITRIAPPRDVVKFADRLSYLLQPPLEYLLSADALEFSRRPFPFQLDGVAYLYPRTQAVLADEMGLGKTMQAIVTLRLLAHEGRVRRALVVCPKPLATNWRRELAQWAPELPVTLVEGAQGRREWIWERATSGVLVANYEVLVRDHERAAAVAAPFDVMIVDEAQRIKNAASATHHAVCNVPRVRSWALTGTPIENSADDLAGIFAFVSPGRVRPQMKPAVLRQTVSDHVLRRTKDQVLTQLPPKTVCDVELGLTAEQWAAYERAEDEGVVRLNDLGAELTIQHVFELVLRLKQICNFDPATGASAKLDRLDADLEECAASGRKAIVFSQWVRTIERLAERLGRFGPLEFHGRIPSGRRDAVLERFREDPTRHVLLMSYGAGSVGLNLQFAGYVFLFDRWWNPAVEDQAINRAHRIGAAGPVTVTRYVTAGTIEERINAVLEQKRELFNAVFDERLLSVKRGLSREDVFGLFNLKFPEANAA